MDKKAVIEKIAAGSETRMHQQPLFRWRRMAQVIDDELSVTDVRTIRAMKWSRVHRSIIESYLEDDNDLARGRMNEVQYIAINTKFRSKRKPYRLSFDRKYSASTPFKERLVNICRVALT